MKRFPLLFLAAGLVSCAPLPPLVTDPPEEIQPAETVSSSSAEVSSAEITASEDSITKTKPIIAIVSENAEDSIPDSSTVEDFRPIVPIDSAVQKQRITSSHEDFPILVIPETLNRDFRVGIQVGVSKTEISGSTYTLSFHENASNATQKSGIEKITANGFRVATSEGKTDSAWIFPTEGSRITVDGREYRGKILVVNSSKKLTVINVLPVEDYLKGVVPNEIGKLDSSMFEALKVQSIAARTYAYHHFNSRASLGFDVFSTVQDQVYNGYTGESALPNAAIDSTAGVVLTSNGDFIEAYYHSTCGGLTEGVEVWGLKPVEYLKSQNDMKSADSDSAWCGSSTYSSWKKVYSEKELLAMFHRNFKDAKADGKQNFSKLQQVEIKSRFPGGRVNELEVLTDKGIFTVKGDKTRWLFKEGSKILPSSKFNIEKNGKVWVLDGAGFGHGIGMCQMGARARAKAGQNFIQILSAYYPGATLQCISGK